MTTETQTPLPGSTTRDKTPIKKKKGRPRKPLTPEQLATNSLALREKYPHAQSGTRLNATKGQPTPGLNDAEVAKYKHKRSIAIKCTTCSNERRIATSDLAQVHLCENCTRNARNSRKRQRRAAHKK